MLLRTPCYPFTMYAITIGTKESKQICPVCVVLCDTLIAVRARDLLLCVNSTALIRSP
jgi:hypothetical protein